MTDLQQPDAAEAARILDELPVLRSKIAKSADVDAPGADSLFQEVLRFLHLIAMSNEKLTPSLPVDLAWHEFILCTRAYHEYCATHFGRFIHHHPGGTESENRRQYRRTLALYTEVFGPPSVRFWGTTAEAFAPACGNCEGA